MLIANDVARRVQQAPAAAVPFAAARTLIDRHCVMCHSATPVHAGIVAPPAGLDFTRNDVVHANAARILLQAVTTKAMPLGNESGMTDVERAELGAWIRQGAQIP
jgi:uncharacterized membrane protein